MVEHYSSSEASLVAANLPRPAASKPGSLGIPWPNSVIIVDDDSHELLPNEQGEILVRGPTVISGYLDAEDINRRSFFNGWFRTGDIGSLDEDGFLGFHGRKSDVINRGGEKISPIEIDDALLRHPAVAEAVAFPVAHPRLGEDVAAAVVLKPGAVTTQRDLRRSLQKTLAPFKLPRRIHLVEALPKGNTGKVRRRDLSQIMSAQSPRSSGQRWDSFIEVEIALIWQDLLQRKDIGAEDDFFELGGDSFLATQMLLEVERRIERPIPIEVLFDNATIRQLADALSQEPPAKGQSLLVQLQPDGKEAPFIYVHGDWQGGIYVGNLAKLLGPDRTVYALQSHGFLSRHIPSIKQMAEEYKQALDAAGVRGPYRLGGHCNGALIALELARQLEAEGKKVELVTIIDAFSLNTRQGMRLVARLLQTVLKLFVHDAQDRQRRHESIMSSIWWTIRWAAAEPYPRRPLFQSLCWRAARKAKSVVFDRGKETKDIKDASVQTNVGTMRFAQDPDNLLGTYHHRMAGYIPMPIRAPILSIVSKSCNQRLEFNGAAWRDFTTQNDVVIVPGDHLSCVTIYADILANHVRTRLVALDRNQAPETLSP